MKRTPKGCYGYINYKKKFETIKTIVLFAVSLSLFFAGWYTTKSRMNLLTVVAILGMLPASKSAVTMFMILKSKGCSERVHNLITEWYTKNECTIYGIFDLNITTYKATYQISHLVVKEKTICALTETPSSDLQTFEKYINESLINSNYKGYHFKTFEKEEKYLERLAGLSKLEEDENKDMLFDFFMGISL